MPRSKRVTSGSKIYHVMIRGINRQNIFEESEDFRKFLRVLSDCREKDGFELYAYCLMPNHAHILIKEGNVPLAITFRRLGSKYVYWFNTKYERVGHLFQDRFKSEPVDESRYFITVLRYIHFNPVKAGLCKNLADYPYSSFIEYKRDKGITDKQFVRELLPGNSFFEFHNDGCNDTCLDLEEKTLLRLTNESACRVMRLVTKCDSSAAFQALDHQKRLSLITELKAHGLSIRQISRLTGESSYLIRKA